MDNEAKIRYARALSLHGFGKEGQERLSAGSVLLVGAGALGSVAGLYLAGAGVGRIGVADFDTVDVSNLQRQPAFTEQNLGMRKSAVLAARMREINSGIMVDEIPRLVKSDDAAELFAEYQFIIDASDNPATKNMTASVCSRLGKPYCIGAVREYSCQLSTHLPGAAQYTDIFPQPAEGEGIAPCYAGGVFGPAPGITGTLQASEAIKYLSGCGALLINRLLIIDLRTMDFRVIEI